MNTFVLLIRREMRGEGPRAGFMDAAAPSSAAWPWEQKDRQPEWGNHSKNHINFTVEVNAE